MKEKTRKESFLQGDKASLDAVLIAQEGKEAFLKRLCNLRAPVMLDGPDKKRICRTREKKGRKQEKSVC